MVESFMNDCIYFRADSLEFAVDIAVGEAQHGHAKGFNGGSASFVIGVSFRGEVLGAVQLDDEARLFTVEVGDVAVNGLLSLETWLIAVKKVVPEVILMRGGDLAEGLGKGDEVFVVFKGHGCSSPVDFSSHSRILPQSPRKRGASIRLRFAPEPLPVPGNSPLGSRFLPEGAFWPPQAAACKGKYSEHIASPQRLQYSPQRKCSGEFAEGFFR